MWHPYCPSLELSVFPDWHALGTELTVVILQALPKSDVHHFLALPEPDGPRNFLRVGLCSVSPPVTERNLFRA